MTIASSTTDRARAATPEDPLRILVSACLVGEPTGWDGVAYPEQVIIELTALPNVRAVPFCPEDPHLGTPRPFTTIYAGNGNDVLDGKARVLDTDGRNCTTAILRGAEAMRDLALREQVELAILMDVSDSCGTNAIYLGDPASKTYQKGPGVAAAMLLREGLSVIAQRDTRTVWEILVCLDPSRTVPKDATNFVDEQWYRDYFAGRP